MEATYTMRSLWPIADLDSGKSPGYMDLKARLFSVTRRGVLVSYSGPCIGDDV